MRRNLYDLLGVRPDDDAETLRRAFRLAARESHPDHHGDDPEAAARFRQIAEAYDILRDAEQRAAYDRLLEVERRPLRSKLKQALSDATRHMVADAVVGVILVIVLAGGYELYSRASETADDDPAMAARDSARIAVILPAAVEGDRLADAELQMPLALPVAKAVARGEGAVTGATIGGAAGGGGSDVPVEQAGAKGGRGDFASNRRDGLPELHEARPAGVQVSAVETHDSVPGLSLSGTAAPANRPGGGMPETVGVSTGNVKQPAETRFSGGLHAAMKRPPTSRASFRHASLVHRHALSRMDYQYCEDDTPHPFTGRYSARRDFQYSIPGRIAAP